MGRGVFPGESVTTRLFLHLAWLDKLLKRRFVKVWWPRWGDFAGHDFLCVN